MDAERRHKAIESDKALYYSLKKSKQSDRVMLVPASCTQVPWGDAKCPLWVPAPTVDCVTRGNAEFGRFTAFFFKRFIYSFG